MGIGVIDLTIHWLWMVVIIIIIRSGLPKVVVVGIVAATAWDAVHCSGSKMYSFNSSDCLKFINIDRED